MSIPYLHIKSYVTDPFISQGAKLGRVSVGAKKLSLWPVWVCRVALNNLNANSFSVIFINLLTNTIH